MRRLVSIDTDERFFSLFQAALKSFLRYNPDWDVEIIDIGMTKAQRHEIAGVGKIVELKRTADPRWPSGFSRLRYFMTAADRTDLLFHLDADTLTFGSIEPWIQQFFGLDVDVSFVDGIYTVGELIRIHGVARKVFPRFDSWKDLQDGNAGILLAKASVFAKIAKRVLDIADKFAGLFTYSEQEVINSVIYEDGFNLLRASVVYNFTLADPQKVPVVLVEPPLTADRQRVVIAHIRNRKGVFFTGDGPCRHIGRWWTNIVERYEEEPWPIHASP